MLRKRYLSVCLLAVGLLVAAALAPMVRGDDAPGGAPPPRQPGGGGPGGGFHLLPRFVEDKLDLTDDQKKQIDELEKDTKAKLAKILTADQMKTLQDARPPHGPGGGQGGGPGGGQGGPGGGDQGGGQGRPPRPSN